MRSSVSTRLYFSSTLFIGAWHLDGVKTAVPNVKLRGAKGGNQWGVEKKRFCDMTGEVEKSKLIKKQFKPQPYIHGRWVSRHRGVMQGCTQASWIISSLRNVHGVHQSVLNTNVVLAVNTTEQTHMWRSWRSNPAMISSKFELVWPVFAWADLSSYGCCLLFAWSDACVI